MKKQFGFFHVPMDSALMKKKEKLITDLVSKYQNLVGKKTFVSWQKYLFTECKTPESVINFANLFWIYGGQDYPINEPYKFLGYFYYRINFETAKYDKLMILDSLAIDILPKAGYLYADRFINDDYIPELDPNIIKQVEEYKSLGL